MHLYSRHARRLRLALALDVTADELVFDKAERQPQMLDKELLKNWEKIDELPDDDKLAVKKIVAALLVKHSVELAVRRDANFLNN